MEINTLELSKIPPTEDGTNLWAWMKFLNAESKEEFDMVAERNPTIRKAVVRLEELSQDERTRMIYESQQLKEWDLKYEREYEIEAAVKAATEEARKATEAVEKKAKKAMFDMVRNLTELNVPVEKIVEASGYSYAEIEAMQNADY
jgi:cysteinyl-tRNA synthetase